PAKLVSHTITLPTIQAKITYIDFSAVHDTRSLRMLLPLINPRKLILTSGSETQTFALANELRVLLNPRSAGNSKRRVEVFAPRMGESVDASVDTESWSVVVDPTLWRGLRWQGVGGVG